VICKIDYSHNAPLSVTSLKTSLKFVWFHFESSVLLSYRGFRLAEVVVENYLEKKTSK